MIRKITRQPSGILLYRPTQSKVAPEYELAMHFIHCRGLPCLPGYIYIVCFIKHASAGIILCSRACKVV